MNIILWSLRLLAKGVMLLGFGLMVVGIVIGYGGLVARRFLERKL